jgi:hypothetical protein
MNNTARCISAVAATITGNLGVILISPSLGQEKELGIDDEMRVHLSQEHQSYMNYHRENIFIN